MSKLTTIRSFILGFAVTIAVTACGGGGGGGGGTTPLTYTVGGVVSGLTGTVVLQNNGTDDLTLDADGNFTFATALADAANYSVAVLSHPAGQNCNVSNGSGAVSGVNVSDVTVTCADTVAGSSYSVGGTVNGLIGTLELQNNGGDNLTVSVDGSFSFVTLLNDGAAYSVAVLTQPAGQDCSVASGSGTIAGADVTSVDITCSGASGFNLYDYGVTTNSPSIVVAGIRITDRVTGLPVSGLTGSDFEVKENDLAINPLEAFVDAEQIGDANLTLQTVLLLDISTSLLPADIAQVKAAAKQAISYLEPGHQVAIYTFDSTVTEIQSYTDDHNALNAAIDTIPEDLLSRGNSTNLLGAVETGAGAINNFFNLDDAQYGYVILVSDGDHTTDTRIVADIQATIAGKDIFAIAIGSLVDTTVLAEITGTPDRVFSVTDTATLATELSQVQVNALNQTQGLYRVYYASPKRTGTHAVSYGLLNNEPCSVGDSNCNTLVTGAFVANGFSDVVPEVVLRVPDAEQPANLSQTVLPGDVRTVEARVRWINSTPSFSFSISAAGGAVPTLTQISDNQQSVVFSEGLIENAVVTVEDVVTGLSQSVSFYIDTDADGQIDRDDTDDDNDGVSDALDIFPLDAAESVDTDGDGVGNNADTDDDNDGVMDNDDAFPLDATESVDTDGDGVGNNADTDDDNDGIPDSYDASPLTFEQAYKIGGTVYGLESSTIVIKSSLGEALSLNTDGAFEFAVPIIDGAPYVVSIEIQPAGEVCNVVNGAGTISSSNVVDIEVDCMTWKIPQLIETNTTVTSQMGNQALGFDANGNVLAVWSQRDPADPQRSNAYSNRRSAHSNIWSTPEKISSSDWYNSVPEIAITDSLGNAIAGWADSDAHATGNIYRTWVNRYDVDLGWTGAVQLPYQGNICNVTSDGHGNSAVIWQYRNISYPTNSKIYINVYSSGALVGSTYVLNGNNCPLASYDSNGNLALVYEKYSGTVFDLYSVHYKLATGWTTPGVIENSANQIQIRNANMAGDASGRLVVAWSESNGTANDIWLTSYLPANGWEAPKKLDSVSENATYPTVSMNQNGKALIVWVQPQSGGTLRQMWAATYTPWSRVTAGTVISDLIYDYSGAYGAVYDNNNNAVVVIRRVGSPADMLSVVYTPTSGWKAPELIENGDYDVTNAWVAGNLNGDVLVTYGQSDGAVSDAWSRVYSPLKGWGAATIIDDKASVSAWPNGAYIDADGNGVVTWVYTKNSANHLSVSDYR